MIGANILKGSTPFYRLARTHCFSVAGDALLTIALADSIFFGVDPSDARWQVVLYLLLTIAPFAVVAPLLGPFMDRLTGGHRYMIIGSVVIRALVMVALFQYVQTLFLYPLAFTMLVMGKTYAVAKSAVVPALVTDEEELVKSNSQLAVLSAVSGALAGIPGVLLLQFGGSQWVLAVGASSFITAVILGWKIPATRVAAGEVPEVEKAEMRSATIRLAAGAMGFLRAGVGFITILLAFELRGGIDPGPEGPGVELGHQVRESFGLLRLDLATGGAPTWHFGVALLGAGAGGLIGSATSPQVRKIVREERILAFALVVVTGAAVASVLVGGLVAVLIVSAAVGLAAQGGKQAFDSIVQRDAPKANLGRVFSRFESRFQLLWVLAALLPVLLPMPVKLGYLLLGSSAGLVAVSYWLGRAIRLPTFRRNLQRSTK